MIQRLTKEVVVKHADGTGYVLGIGTPVTSTDSGVVPVQQPYLRGVPAIPKSETLGYKYMTAHSSLANLGDLARLRSGHHAAQGLGLAYAMELMVLDQLPTGP